MRAAGVVVRASVMGQGRLDMGVPVFACVSERLPRKTKADGSHLGQVCDSAVHSSHRYGPVCRDSAYAVFMEVPHFSMIGVQRLRMLSSSGTTLGAFRPGYCDSYGGFSLIFQKKRHLGSGECAVMSSGRSAGSRRAITLRQGSSTAHLGFSVFSSVTPT